MRGKSALFRFVVRNGFRTSSGKFCAQKVATRKVLGFCASAQQAVTTAKRRVQNVYSLFQEWYCRPEEMAVLAGYWPFWCLLKGPHCLLNWQIQLTRVRAISYTQPYSAIHRYIVPFITFQLCQTNWSFKGWMLIQYIVTLDHICCRDVFWSFQRRVSFHKKYPVSYFTFWQYDTTFDIDTE